MNSEQITAFLQEHWYIASVVIGAVILIGAVRNWNWLCDPTGTRDAHRHSRGYLSFTTHADGNELELTGNRAGLLLLAKAALGMAETVREDGFHIHLDDLYDINAEGKTILIQREESKP